MKGIICYGFNLAGVVWLAVLSVAAQPPSAPSSAANPSAPIPMDQLGAVAGKQYQGDGLSVTAAPDGARLRCAFQRLEGEVFRDGLWLRSTAGDAQDERFRVMAVAVGRQSSDRSAAVCEAPAAAWSECFTRCGWVFDHSRAPLESTGSVLVHGQTVRFRRPGLTEEYSVSVDGVRQDFIVEQQPAGEGELRVELDVTGARVEPLVNGVRLVLDGSGRNLAYNRLRVTDATGRELTARMEVASGILPDVEDGILPPGKIARTTDVPGFNFDEFASFGFSAGLEATALRPAEMPAAATLAVVVDDAAAVYPVRIDPTFSDADWNSMVGSPGLNSFAKATVVDDSGNLYVGGHFTTAGGISANRVAKWDGTAWSALGSGMNNTVNALAVSGTNLYAGGTFTTAGGTVANRIAKWDGNAWSVLGSGIGLGLGVEVIALAVSGTNLYAGGLFATAGGVAANYIAKWDGTAWSALGSGMGGAMSGVFALAVSGTNLFAGGTFTTAGGNAAYYIAKWNGSAWSALGAGMNAGVEALVISGTNLYAGGGFTTAGGAAANSIAKWNGNGWSALGSGTDHFVSALAMAGTNLYAGGFFTTAGGVAANYIAKWNGSTWSGLGSGLDRAVNALAVAGWNLYAGGDFTTAGNKTSTYIAAAYIGPARGRFNNLAYAPATGFSCTFLDGTVGQPYRIRSSPSLAVGLWTDLTNFSYAGPIVITDDSAVSATNTFYRAVTP